MTESFLDRTLAKAKARNTRPRLCDTPDYSCVIFPDSNANPGAVIDIVSELDNACRLLGGKTEFRIGFTETLLKENCNYLSRHHYNTENLIENSINLVRSWQKEAQTIVDALGSAKEESEFAVSQRAIIGLLQKAEDIITGDMAFLVGNIPERLTGKPEYKGAKITQVRDALKNLQTALQDESDDIEKCKKTLQTSVTSLGQAMYAVLPKTLMDYHDDRGLFVLFSGTSADTQLERAFGGILMPQVRLRLMAYQVNKDHMQNPDDIVITPELRDAYALACQPVNSHTAEEMKGIETVGLTAQELKKLRSDASNPDLSFSQALMRRGLKSWVPVSITVKAMRKTCGAEEIPEFIDNLRAIAEPSQCQFELQKIGDDSKPESCSLDMIMRYASRQEPPPYGYELIASIPKRTVPNNAHTDLHYFDDLRNGKRRSPSYLPLNEIEKYIEEMDLSNKVISVDIVKNRVRERLDVDPKPYELPANSQFDAYLKQRLFELAQDGKKMLPDIQSTLKRLRQEPSEDEIINKFCFISASARNFNNTENQVEKAQQVFFHTQSIKEYMATLSKNGPYGKIKFNAGERGVYEGPVIEKQARVMVAENHAVARAKALRTNGEEEIPAHLAKAHSTLKTRDLHMFVTQDTGAKKDGEAYLQKSEAHIPMLTLNIKEFYLLAETMLRVLEKHQRTMQNAGELKNTLGKLSQALTVYKKYTAMNGEVNDKIDAVAAYYETPPLEREAYIDKLKKDDSDIATLIEHANACGFNHFLAKLSVQAGNPGPGNLGG